MKSFALILAVISLSASSPPQLPKSVVRLQSPKIASSSSAASLPMMVVIRRAPPPQFSAAFTLDDPTNTLAGVNLITGSATSNYTRTNFVPISALTNNPNYGYVVTLVFSNLANNQPVVLTAYSIGTNGLASLTNSPEAFWNIGALPQVWVSSNTAHLSIKSVSGHNYWLYDSPAPAGPWMFDGILTGNGGVLQTNFPLLSQRYFRVVEGN